MLETLVGGGAFYEGPRWREGRWWISDFYRRAVYAITPDGHEEEVLAIDGNPSGLGWLPDGSLLVVSMKARQILRRSPGGQLTVHADLGELTAGHANDMAVDDRGRAYVGNFGFDLMAGERPRPTVLVRVDPDGSTSVVADDLLFPNGTLITPDGGTLIVAETYGARLTAFTIASDGSLHDRRVWARLEPPFSPDGTALDAEGCVWAADAMGSRVVRLAEGGEIREEVRMPDGLGVFACGLGGEDGCTLLLCTAPDFDEGRRSAAREAVLLTTTVSVPAPL